MGNLRQTRDTPCDGWATFVTMRTSPGDITMGREANGKTVGKTAGCYKGNP